MRPDRYGIPRLNWSKPNDVRIDDAPRAARIVTPILATPPVVTRSSRISRNWPGKKAIALIDLGPRDRADALAAASVARRLGVQLQLVHVVEPIPDIPWLELDEARRNTQRHRKALAELTKLKEELAWLSPGARS